MPHDYAVKLLSRPSVKLAAAWIPVPGTLSVDARAPWAARPASLVGVSDGGQVHDPPLIDEGCRFGPGGGQAQVFPQVNAWMQA